MSDCVKLMICSIRLQGAWTALIGACAAYAAVAFPVPQIRPRPAVPERIEVVIVGQDKETPKPDHQRIGQKNRHWVVGNSGGIG